MATSYQMKMVCKMFVVLITKLKHITVCDQLLLDAYFNNVKLFQEDQKEQVMSMHNEVFNIKTHEQKFYNYFTEVCKTSKIH